MTTQSSTRTAVSTQVAAEGKPPVTFQEMERAAQAVAKSGLFGFKDASEVLAIMVAAQADGVHYGRAVREYNPIQGRASMKAEAMQARFQQAGGRIEWHELTDAKASATFSHPQGGSVRIEWDIARAERAGLANKENWKRYPRPMLASRVKSEGIRTVFPGCILGLYTPEEITDMIDVTPTKQQEALDQFQKEQGDSGLTQAEMDEHMAALKAADTFENLKAAFNTAWVHAKQAKDEASQKVFKGAYDVRKGELGVAT